jgi:8-oxo-dGTP pyrophosphatase MutT (NUDIX family)
MTARVDLNLDQVRAALKGRRPVVAPPGNGQRSAVAAVLRERPGGVEVLLIRRAAREGDPWSGHMAFPGGRADPADGDLLETAARETHEEVGLDLRTHAELVGRLDDLEAVARGKRVGMTIAPFVFALTEEAPLVTNEEVEETIWASLSPLARGENATTVDYEVDGQKLTLPAFDVHGRIVWGLTYRMLQALFAALDAE